ncbi:MAG: ankyrin repeat domain-containing protein [Acidobacteriota bacterium]
MSADTTNRNLPVRPNLDQLKHQAKDLLRAVRRGDPSAIEEFKQHHPKPIEPEQAKLAAAQLALARSYQLSGWPRLVQACKLIDAIWDDDIDLVRALILKHPHLLHEMARGTKKCNWGPPMSYAANLGRNGIIRMLHELGARDHMHAIDRATLQSKIETARMLYEMMGSPRLPKDALGGPAYTLSASGTELMFELGAQVLDADGKRLAPVDVVLETDSRNPLAKHQILEMYVRHGLDLPDTPVMALHRGRIDLLEDHLRRDAKLLQRTFTHEEIYPPELGCHDEVLATQGTPLKGATLLHMCVDYDELEIARWLIERGMDVDLKAAVDAEGFGGHTALFATIVSQPNYWMNRGGSGQLMNGVQAEILAPFTKMLLDHGANPNSRAALRKQLHPGYVPKHGDGEMHEYRDVTPLSWGARFPAKMFVSAPAMQLIAEQGGHE